MWRESQTSADRYVGGIFLPEPLLRVVVYQVYVDQFLRNFRPRRPDFRNSPQAVLFLTHPPR